MEETKFARLKNQLAELKIFNSRYRFLSFLLVWMWSKSLDEIIERDNSWHEVGKFLPLTLFVLCLELSLRCWPQGFNSIILGWHRLNSGYYKAWNVQGLATLFVLSAMLLVWGAIPHGIVAFFQSLGLSAAIAIFLWFFVSLQESWGKRIGGATFIHSCLFVLSLLVVTVGLILGASLLFA